MSSNDTGTDTCQMLVDAIIGRGFISIEDAKRFERLKMAYFSGNQHNYEWSWHRDKLAKLTEHQLLAIYRRE